MMTGVSGEETQKKVMFKGILSNTLTVGLRLVFGKETEMSGSCRNIAINISTQAFQKTTFANRCFNLRCVICFRVHFAFSSHS